MNDDSGNERAPAAAVRSADVLEFGDDGSIDREDRVAVEEPLEVRVVLEREGRRERHSIAITMRTPGHDLDLAVGFLFSEGVVSAAEQIWRVDHCRSTDRPESQGNIVEVQLAPGVAFEAERSSRKVYTTSSCGVCGRGSLELLWTASPARPVGDNLRLDPATLRSLPEKLESSQRAFGETGGLHAAALCAADGSIQLLREDVGRHNAVDKLVGERLRDGGLPLSDTLLLVSGRASFELVQKAIMAGAPALAAVGAPSSLAVSAAEEFGLTLIGFLSDRRFNVYSGRDRVRE